MAPKRKMALFTLPSSTSVPVSIPMHTLPEHPIVKDSFWEKALNDPIEAGPAFEYLTSGFIRSGLPLDCQIYRTLFQDNDDCEGPMISPTSIPKMRIKREEVPFCGTRFESKAQTHQVFNKWVGWVIAQPGVKKLFKRLGIMKAITQGRSTAIARNLPHLGFLISRWSTETHTFVVSYVEFISSLENVVVLTLLPLFGDAHSSRVTLSGEANRRSSF